MANMQRLNRLDAMLTYLIEHPETKVTVPVPVHDDEITDITVCGFDLTQFAQLGPDSCGTVACACGWAGLETGFRAEGFTLDLDAEGDGVVCTKDSTQFGAVEQFFDLTVGQARDLFMPADEYQTPTDVRQLLRRMFGTDPTGIQIEFRS